MPFFQNNFTKYSMRWLGATNTAPAPVQLIDQPSTPRQGPPAANKFALGAGFVGFEEPQLERNRGALEFDWQHRPSTTVPFVDANAFMEDEMQLTGDGAMDKYASTEFVTDDESPEPAIGSPSTEVRNMLRDHEGHNRHDVLQRIRLNFSESTNRAVKCEAKKELTVGEKLKAKPWDESTDKDYFAATQKNW